MTAEEIQEKLGDIVGILYTSIDKSVRKVVPMIQEIGEAAIDATTGMTEPEKLCYSVKELGELFGVSLPVAYNISKIQGFPSISIGRRVVIPKDALKKWLDENVGKKLF